MPAPATATALPAFLDNYIWFISRASCPQAVVVDPGDPAPVIARLEKSGLGLSALLITHHHADHIGGIHALVNRYPGLKVYGPDNENIPHRTDPVREGAGIAFDQLDLNFRVIEVPGHTHGHIAYYEERHKWLFCGDTLFVVGCGRVFSGTHEHLYASLARIAQLPPATQVYCAHEYTLDNIGFARWVEPDNANLSLFDAECRQKLRQGLPTVPSTIRRELLCNPFLRLEHKAVKEAARAWGKNSKCQLSGMNPARPEHIFHLIRNWKDVAYD